MTLVCYSSGVTRPMLDGFFRTPSKKIRLREEYILA